MYKVYKNINNKLFIRPSSEDAEYTYMSNTLEFLYDISQAEIEEYKKIPKQKIAKGDIITISPLAIATYCHTNGYVIMDDFINTNLICTDITDKTVIIDEIPYDINLFDKVSIAEDEIKDTLLYISIIKDVYDFPNTIYTRIARVSEGMIKWKEGDKKFKIKPGRWMKKFTSDSELIERFANTVKSTNSQVTFEIVKGKDILTAYHEDNYYSENGTMGNSCMRYKETQNNLLFYTAMPNISLLVGKIDNKVVGRAIIWDDLKFIDRIYTNFDYITPLFLDWAKTNGYITKEKQTFDYQTAPDLTYEINIDPVILDKKNNKSAHFPYMDSLKFLSRTETGYIISTRPPVDKSIKYITLENTDYDEDLKLIWD